MKLIVKDVNYDTNVFYGIVDNKLTGFYLTNKLSENFINNIEIGYLVDFEILNKTKVVDGFKCYQVNHFTLIKNLKSKKELYNQQKLNSSMITFLKSHEYVLFLDLEMSIGGYGQKNYQSEIVQYGYLLVDNNNNIIKTGDNYLLTHKPNEINQRTFKFLKINEDDYFQQAIEPMFFYNELKEIITNYFPKVIVWGKNDIRALNYFYKIYNVKPLTNNNDFIDLLRLHRNYFNLKNDLGLFNAYKTYYNEDVLQKHHAKEDAKITKKVFDAFIKYGDK